MNNRQLLIWALHGKRAGDNSQVSVIADAVAKACDGKVLVKKMQFHRGFGLPNLLFSSGRMPLKGEMEPPWPDLVVAAGRRSVPVVKKIQKLSEGKTKTVHIGRPRAPLGWFDLVVTTPQYGLPADDNVAVIPLPFSQAGKGTGNEDEWDRVFRSYKQPFLGVLVGAGKYPFVLNELAVDRMIERLIEHGKATGGSSLVATSPRTPENIKNAILRKLPTGSYFYDWQKATDNPLAAILAKAESFLVTGESASMISDAMMTGRPVEVFELPVGYPFIRWRADGGLIASLARNGILTPPRDMTRLHRQLGESGYDQGEQLERVVKRVLALF